MTIPQSPPDQRDKDAILKEFFSALFPKPEGFIELRAIHRSASVARRAFFASAESEAMVQWLRRFEQYNLYFGVALRVVKGAGSLKNCGWLSVVWVDIDFKTVPEPEARARLAAFPLPPSIVLTSGGGLHVYWLLRGPLDLRIDANRARSLLRRLALALGGDLASAEPARVLRVPGTLNYKYTPPRPVTLELLERDRRYTLTEIERHLPEERAHNGQRPRFTVSEKIPDGERNTTLYRLGRSLHAKGTSFAAILAALKAENAERSDPPLSEKEVEIITEKAFKQADREDFSPGTNGREDAPNDPDDGHDHRPPPEPWPVLGPEALYGLPGRIVTAIDPYTEADPVAVLIHLLVATGNVIGSGPHARVQHDRHPLRLNAVLVGSTAKGRKGISWSTPREMLSQVDPEWARCRIMTGLSSGEGLINQVRDAIGEGDQGESDKRLLIIEPEFPTTLKVMAREGNSLSGVVRGAWDSGSLATLTKNSPLRATGTHISIIGHATEEEVCRNLNETDRANGFANRFLWIAVKRSKLLPEGGQVPEAELVPLVEALRDVVKFAREIGEIKRDDEARTMWAQIYPALSEGKPGMFGAIISRAEAQVLRLSALYAVLDRSPVIRVEHLKAALAVWEYAESSARRIFGSRLGNPVADRILAELRKAGDEGLTETQIRDLFRRHKRGGEIDAALSLLLDRQLVLCEQRATKGRPATVWRAVV